MCNTQTFFVIEPTQRGYIYIYIYIYIVVFDCMCTTQTFFAKAHFLYNRFNLILVSSSTCFEHQSVHPQQDLYMQFCGISFMDWIYERNTTKLHVQIFLRTNTLMFETRCRHYN